MKNRIANEMRGGHPGYVFWDWFIQTDEIGVDEVLSKCQQLDQTELERIFAGETMPDASLLGVFSELSGMSEQYWHTMANNYAKTYENVRNSKELRKNRRSFTMEQPAHTLCPTH